MVRSLEHGGCERDLTKIAVGLDQSRFTPHVGVFREGGVRTAELKAAEVPIARIPVESLVKMSVFHAGRVFGNYIRQNRIRLVHAFDVPTVLFAAPAARWHKVPVVISAQLSYRYFYGRFGRAGLRLTDRLSDAVVVNSHAVAETLLTEYRVPLDKIDVCHNGVDAREFHPGPKQSLPELYGATLVVGSVCVMRQEKRMDWVVRAFAKVHRTNPGIHLLLVGSGPETERLHALARELEVHEVTHFHPAQAQVAPWMRTIDIYVNSSYSESFPNALLEAMACGCFPIGSNVGGIPELISHGKNGFLFESKSEEDLAEKLKRAVEDEAVRDSLRQCATVTAHQQFAMKLTLARTEALYHRLLIKRGVIEV
jgi:glycosyltransferase involved in cell wall biosynthesis